MRQSLGAAQAEAARERREAQAFRKSTIVEKKDLIRKLDSAKQREIDFGEAAAEEAIGRIKRVKAAAAEEVKHNIR